MRSYIQTLIAKSIITVSFYYFTNTLFLPVSNIAEIVITALIPDNERWTKGETSTPAPPPPPPAQKKNRT